MNRRTFLYSSLYSIAGLLLPNPANAEPSPQTDVCVMKNDEITTEATGFKYFEHYHQLSIPVAALIQPPDDGIKVRTTVIDQGSYDPKGRALPGFTGHSHAVSFTKDELSRIAQGEKNVMIRVLSPLGNFAHEFFFTAPKSALIKVQRGKLAGPKAELCLVKLSEISAESTDSPFFEHYHQLAIPVASLIQPPATGIVVKTSPVDQGSFDQETLSKFAASSGLDAAKLQRHSHSVALTRSDLSRIADGEKNVEIRVISPNKNYVHNFFFTAPPSLLVKVRRAREKQK